MKHSDGAHIIIVDDHSTDESVSYVQTKFPDITIIRKNTHEGFTSTVNAGVKEANTDIVVLLNTDIEPEKNFLKPLFSHFFDSGVFAVGCMDKSVENGKKLLRGRGIGWWEKGFYIHKRGEVNESVTAWVSGGSGAFRRSMWNELGGMDTIFNPFYWEDIDLSYRARKAGWKTLFEPKSLVVHFHEEGKIKKEYTEKEIKRIAYRNQFIFIWKNCTDWKILLIHSIWLPIRLIQAFFRGDFSLIWGCIEALWNLPKIIQRRCMQQRFSHLSDSDLNMSH